MTSAETTEDVTVPGRRDVGVVMATLALAVLLAALEQTVVATALPTIAGELGGLTSMSMIVTSYLVAAAVATPIASKCGDLYGRRPVFLAAMTLFALGSLFGGLSQELWQLVGARALQGAGGGALMTLALAIVAEAVPTRYRARYQGFLGSVFGLASIVGPLVGGYITEYASWRWIFFVNIPLCALIAAASLATIPVGARRRGAHLDIAGIAVMTLMLVSTLVTLDWGGSRYAWSSPVILGLAAVAVLSTAAFILVELRTAEPLVPLRLFRQRRFVAPLVVGGLMAMTLFIVVTYLSTFLQYALRVEATEAGLLLVPFMMTVVVVSTAAGALASRRDSYRMFPRLGTLLAAAGVLSLAFIPDDAPLAQVIVSVVVLGAGFGMTMQLIVLAAQDAVPKADLGVGTGLVMLARSFGAVLGVAIWGTLFAALYTQSAATVQGLPDASAITPEALAAMPAGTAHATAAAISDSLRTVFQWAAVPAAIAVVAAFGITESRRSADAKAPHEDLSSPSPHE